MRRPRAPHLHVYLTVSGGRHARPHAQPGRQLGTLPAVSACAPMGANRRNGRWEQLQDRAPPPVGVLVRPGARHPGKRPRLSLQQRKEVEGGGALGSLLQVLLLRASQRVCREHLDCKAANVQSMHLAAPRDRVWERRACGTFLGGAMPSCPWSAFPWFLKSSPSS